MTIAIGLLVVVIVAFYAAYLGARWLDDETGPASLDAMAHNLGEASQYRLPLAPNYEDGLQ